MILQGERIKLRAVEPSDANLLYEWENDTTVWHVSNTITPFSKEVIKQYLSSAHLDIYTTKQLRLIIETENKNAIGCIDLYDFNPLHLRAGIGILISAAEHRRKGYADEALNILIKYAFNTLNLNQIFCDIGVENTGSIALFQKHNFKIVGTKMKWVRNGKSWGDVHFLQLINE
ncbi:MAG: Spermidine N(1)-acetyltransferase [Bacteroidia bacterium]|nr:Spermidine N(1)-acetyltransferase [Bacteroidia bacterium]